MIGSDIVGPTNLGSSTVKTQIGGVDLVLPAWARSIVAVRPTLTTDLPIALESVIAQFTLESDDFAIQPYLALCNPIEPFAGTQGSVFSGEPPWYPVNCPVNGGDRLRVYGQALDAVATGGDLSVQIILDDKKRASQLHAKIGTVTPTGTTPNININEPAYTISGGKMIRELFGIVGVTDSPNGTSVTGRFEFLSNDLKDPTPLKLPFHPLSGGWGTSSMLTPGLARCRVEVPILSPCQIITNIRMANVPLAGNFITGVLYD